MIGVARKRSTAAERRRRTVESLRCMRDVRDADVASQNENHENDVKPLGERGMCADDLEQREYAVEHMYGEIEVSCYARRHRSAQLINEDYKLLTTPGSLERPVPSEEDPKHDCHDER